jgi:serine/threonine-protein kinase
MSSTFRSMGSMSEPVPLTTRVPEGVLQDAQFQRKYAIERELGVGGAGVVVCARHLELDERVAIKFLLSGHENPEAVARFRREARAANRVRSEHVVRIIDVTTTDSGIPYVVMEYLEGTDLERMLLESPDRQLPVRDAIEFVLQACEALAECHAIGIVHRDLKPSNLFCIQGADGLPCIKVLDFGISKLGPLTIDGAMTGRHAIIGSPRYMPPEQFDSPADVDRRSDIWALGIILYELVTGQVPFIGKTLIAIWESVKRDVPREIGELRCDAPRPLGPIVMRCLEKDPSSRYENVAELAKALLPLAPEHSRSTVARIVRIVESPGVTTEALALPTSGRPSSAAGTSLSLAPASRRPRPWRVVGLSLPLIAAAIGVAIPVANRWREATDGVGAQALAPRASSAASSSPLVVVATALAPPTAAGPPRPAAPAEAASSARAVVVATASAASTVRGDARHLPAGAQATPKAGPSATASASARGTQSETPPEASSSGVKPPWLIDIVERRTTPDGGTR